MKTGLGVDLRDYGDVNRAGGRLREWKACLSEIVATLSWILTQQTKARWLAGV